MNKELWDWGDEQQEQESQAPKRSLFDNLGDAITAIGANFSDVRGSNNIGDLRHDLMENGATMPLEEYNRKVAELEQLYGQREASRQQYQQAHDNLVANDSFLKNIDQLGGTLEGMAAQGIGTAVGAGLGLVGGVGGAAMGAKIGNAAGAVAGGYLDARSVALQAEEEVLDAGGTWEQAKQAYDEALKKASLTTLPETLADIAMGNRLVRAGLSSGVARKIAGSTLGRAGSAVLDPAARLGTKAAFASGKGLVGRGVGLATDVALQGATEAGQEVTQDYIENREVAKALGQQDNEYSLGGFKDFALSPQGLETMKTAGIMGALFGGVGGAVSSGQYLQRGAETNTGIRAHNNAEQMINDGSLKISAEKRRDEEKIISVLKGISPAELASWSDAEIVAEASILEGQYMGVQGEAEDLSTVRGAADVVRRLSDENTGVHREGDLTETTNKFLEGMGVDKEQRQRMFNSPAEMSIIEQARKAQEAEVQAKTQTQEQEGTQKKTAPITATLTEKTAKDMPKTEDGTITTKTDETQAQTPQTNTKETVQPSVATTQPTATPKAVTETPSQKSAANNLEQAAQVQAQQGQITTAPQNYKDNIGGGWETDQKRLNEELDEHPYYNLKTDAEVTIKHRADGQYAIVGESGEGIPFPTLKDAEQYLRDHKDQTVFQGTNGEETEETKEGTVEDPNIVPKGGVNAKEGFSGQLISSVDDLYNFMLKNPSLISRGAFIEYVHAKHNIGFDNIDIYLDKKNEGRVYDSKTGKWGYVNAKKTRDEATGRAILQLYKGADFISAVHEIAHIGYDNLTAAEQRTFDKYAVKSMGQWIADMLDLNYDDAFKQRLNNLQNDQELQEKINKSPALKQTVIEFLNAEKNGIDLNNLTKKQREAIDERWAWEFSLWYTEGYVRGVQPKNVIERLLQRGCFSIRDELEGLHRLWEHIHHKDNNEIEDLYRNMGTNVERQTEGQGLGNIQFTNEFDRLNMPNVNMPMNFGGEQAIQYNVPTLGESYNEASRRAGYYNDAREKQWNLYRMRNLPSADGSVATNTRNTPDNIENRNISAPVESTYQNYVENDPNNFSDTDIKDLIQIGKDRSGKNRQRSRWARELLKQINPERVRRLDKEIADAQNTVNRMVDNTIEQDRQRQAQKEENNRKAEEQQRLNEYMDNYANEVMAQQVSAKNLTNKSENATVEQKREVANNGKTENTRGTENLQGNVGEVQRGRGVRSGDDNRTGEGRIGQDAVEGSSEGDGKNLSLLKNKEVRDTYNKRKQKKTELKDWRNMSDSDRLKQIFVDALNASKNTDMQHGVYVDAKSVEELKDCKVVLHKNKMAGFAITKDGNIVAVFSSPKNPIRGVLNDMIFIAHMMGGNRMDCFGNFLLRGYRACGFMPVARTKFAEEYYPASDPRNATIRKEQPDVFFLVKENDNNETYLSKINNGEYKKDDIKIDDILLIEGKDSYGDALDFQGKVLKGIRKKDNANKSTKEVAESLRPKKETTVENQNNEKGSKRFLDRIEEALGLYDPVTTKSESTETNTNNTQQTKQVKSQEDRQKKANELVERLERYIQSEVEDLSQDYVDNQLYDEINTELKAIGENIESSIAEDVRSRIIGFANKKIEHDKSLQKEDTTKQAKQTTPTDEIYSHLYFGDKTGKLKYNKDTKKIEYFVEEENGRDPETMRRRYKLVNKGEITPEQYNELRLKYEQDFKKTKGEAKDRIPNLVEGMKKEDFMYSAYREIKQSEKEKGEVAVELGKEKQTLVTGKSEEYARQNAAEQSFNRAMSGESLSGMEETELMKEDKEEAQKQVEQELPKVEKKKTEQTTTPKTSTTTTKKTTSTKTTASKPKTTDPLSALHKKYKNITGTPIGEKGYKFKEDEKQFIEGFKGLIDGTIGNKEQLVNIAKELDAWFQNNPTERNRIVRKYLSQYLADAAQIKTNQNTEVRHQEANRAEQAQQILDSAFPNTRFQFAWHSTEHDFTEFTLDHLLSGEGFMAHGWGLYFAKSLKKNKKNYFDKLGRSKYSGKFSYYVNGHDVTQQIYNFAPLLLEYRTNDKFMAKLQEEVKSLSNELNKLRNGVNSKEFYKDSFSGTMYHKGKQAYVSSYTGEIVNKDDIDDYINFIAKELRKGLVIQRQIREHGLKIQGSNKNKLLLVDIPEDNVLLKENKGFKDQPPKVQIALMKLVRKEGLLNGEENTISNKDLMEHFDEILGVDIYEYNGDIYGTLSWLLENDPYGLTDEDTTDQGKERCSKLLNKYGIKGISYDGRFDGECAVIFDDKAIDIITKFRQEEGKWKSEKVDNARNRESDKQKAQRKLEKHRAKDNNTRFQLHSEEGLSKADINSPEFKKWFDGSVLTNKDGSPKIFYRGIDQHYNPEFDKEEGSVVWVTDDLEQAESYRDTQIDMEPTLNRKTGEFTGKPSMQREFLARGAKKESGDLLEAYVSLKKPFNLGIVNDKKSPHDFYVGIGKQLQKDVKDGKITEQQMKSVLADLSYLNKKDAKGNYPTRSIENTKHFKKKFFNAFKKVGYDGVQGQEAGMFGDNRVNVYGVFDKGDIKSIYNKGTFDRNNKDTRFMYGGNQADNQTLLTPKLEKEYEKNFRNYMRLHGFSEAFIDKYFSNDKTGKEQMIPDNVLRGRNLFNKSFEDVFNEYNKQMVKDKGVKRGLDGRWRFEFSDKESKIDSKFVSNAFISKVVNDASKKYETTLQNVLKHDKLFECYPELKGFKVVFATSKYDGLEDADGYSDFNEIALNVDSLKKEKNEKARLSRIRRTLLHEVQHQIQDREGFASGGGATRRELQDRQKDFVTSYINKLGGDVETGKKLINAIEDVIKNIKKVPRNKRGALYDKIRNNAEYFGDNERDFIRKHIKAIINGYINDYQNENKKFGNYINNEIKEMCEYLSLSKDLNINEELLKPIRQFRNVYWTTMGEIEARQTEQRADMTMEERSERTDVLDESVRKMKSFKDAPILVKETIPNIVDDEDTRFQESSKQQLSKRAQQSKQILDRAFPDTRFQFAWHGTPHNFDAFTLDHLLEGEGMMAHGWGLYFGKDLQKIKKNYFDRFNKKKYKQLLFNGQDYSQQLEEMYIKAYDNWSAGREIRDIIEGYGSIEKLKESIDSSIYNAKHSLKSNKQFLKDITGENRSAFEQIFGNGYDRTVKGLEWSIEHDKTIISGLGKIQKILNDKNFEVKESSANILLVNIPEDEVLLREDATFDKQPKYVQKQLLRMFSQTGRRSRKTGLTKNFINRLKNTTDIYGFVADYFGSEQDASLTLSEYGIKGISYRGEIDGECAVIFDADAINILNKFKQEEKKFVSQQKKNRENKQRQEELKNAAEKIEDLLGIRFQEAAKPLTDEEIKEMDKKEEAEYNNRQKRIEDAKDSATLSDDYKDVYSVAFTKSAQGYAENRTRMEYFDNNDRYWDRTEDKSTGKVTYTRKTPFEHHQQVVTYNGVNDVTREQKKKSKPRQWLEWMKDQLIKYMFNDKHYLAKAARKLGVYDAYRKMIVTEGYALKANTALTQGIKYNGKRTRALNDIIRDVGEENQKEFIDYCIAHRIIDLANRTKLEKVSKDDKDAILIDGKYYKRVAAPVFQKMKPDEARKIIAEVKAGKNADMFEKNRKDFVEYNQALLHVLVEGGILTEKKFKQFCEVDPNFVPLAKVMDDADFGFSSIIAAHNLVNVETPIKKIGTSMREVANPFLEMQKRTAEYYSAAARNKAGQIFVNEIAEALDIKYDGNVVSRGQQMINRVKVQEVNGELITKPDDKKQIIYVCNNGEHQFYQIPDREIYEALRSMDSEQMGTIHKMLDRIAHVPSGLVRETATMVPDFGVRNLIRDGGEAFLTSEHGFLPVIDQIWGMWQVANNTEWAQMYFEQNGEYGTLNRDKVNAEGVASVEDVIDEKLNPLTNFNEIKKAQMAILKDKKRQFDILTDIKEGNFGDAWEHTRKSRGMAALKLAISPLWAIGKTNKRMNDLFELGTRVGEFKNAKMGFEGTLDRMAKGLLNTDIRQAKQSDIYSAHVAKDITLNFAQHGVLGKQLNRYIPFFNASLQGIYKLCNTIETMVTGTTMSGGKNRKLQQELLFKAALITAMAIGVASAGDGDEDYEEAPDYEKENFWILPNGLRFPKDQVLGKVIGNTVEKSYAQWKKGKAEPSDILRAIIDNFKPDKFMPAIFDLAIGGFGNYDTFRERAIVPEYMADKLGHLQKDISTSNFAVDVSEALWKCGFNISAKKIDWALQKNFSNCAKYATSIYDLGKKGFNPKDFNERIARGYDKNDSTGAFVAGLKDDVPNPINLVSGTFATNRSTFKSISDFYENYRKYKVLSSDEASMSKEDKRIWKRYEQAYKKDMTFRKQLRAIKQDKNLTGKQKREKADKIFKQQIKLAKWAEG